MAHPEAMAHSDPAAAALRGRSEDPTPPQPQPPPLSVGGARIPPPRRPAQDTVCEVCGNIGYRQLLAYCRDCNCSAVHLYCLEKIIFDKSLAEWWCDECLQRRGEVTCSRSLEVSSQRSPSHAHFGSTIHRQVTRTGAITRARAAAAAARGTPSTSTAPAVVPVPARELPSTSTAPAVMPVPARELPSTSTALAVVPVSARESPVSGPITVSYGVDNIDHIPRQYKHIDDILQNGHQPWNSVVTMGELCSLGQRSDLATKRLQLTKIGRRLLRQKSHLATKRLQLTKIGRRLLRQKSHLATKRLQVTQNGRRP